MSASPPTSPLPTGATGFWRRGGFRPGVGEKACPANKSPDAATKDRTGRPDPRSNPARSRTLKLPTTVLLLALMATACKTTETKTTMYESYGAPEHLGTVTWIKETEKDEKGNPVGGAA